MKTRLQRTELLRAARALSTPKRTAAMFLVALVAILTYPTKTWAQEPIAKIGDTPYESLQDAFNAAADGSTITLLANVDLDGYSTEIKVDEGEKNLTFDLNGKSLTGTNVVLNVRYGINVTIKGGTIGGPNADNLCYLPIHIIGGKVNIEDLTISNCRDGIHNEVVELDEETSVAGELTIGSGVNISATERCIDNYDGKLTLTALPILSWGEDGCGIILGESNMINFAGEGITALPEGFKPIMIDAYDDLPLAITNGYADHVKSGSEVIDPAKVFVGRNDDISIVLYDGEAMMAYGGIQKVSVTKGNEVKEYISLRTAFDEAADGSTITLLDNADIGESTISITADEDERNLTFDLNGFSLTGTKELLYTYSGVNLTVKGGTVGGPDADNVCYFAIHNLGGKVNIENLTIRNCRRGISNGDDWLDEETPVTGELTIGSGVNISAINTCIDNDGELTLTALPILSCGEDYYGIVLGEGQVIHFAGEGITALPEGFKPIKIDEYGKLFCAITNGYADHVKSGSEVIDPAKVFVTDDDDISMVLYDGEAIMKDVDSDIQLVSVTKGDEVKEYYSLQSAFDKAADGSTVTLLDNADLGESTFSIDTNEGEKNLTFDLNGFSLTGTDELFYVYSGVNLTVKGGTVGGPDADNACDVAICNLGGKVYVENLTISNCGEGIYNEKKQLDEETTVAGELTIGSGVNISTTGICIDNYDGILTLTDLPILSWDEEYYGIYLGKGQVIHFAGEGITALPEGFKPIMFFASRELPSAITNGYADHVKSGSEVIDPAKVFAGYADYISMVLYEGEAMMTEGGIQNVSVTKGNEVKEYLSLHTAFDKADDGSTITLLDNADIGKSTINIKADGGERNLTFDLNNFSLTGAEALLYVHSGVNLTVKGGTVGGVDADNVCYDAICNFGGKVNIENLTISNCEYGIYNGEDWIDDETTVAGELTIGSGVNISATVLCIEHFEGKLTLTTLPILSWGEKDYGIVLGEGQVINFAGEGITALPEGFKPIKIMTLGELPHVITNGYSTFFKNIDPADVFDVDNGDESIIVSITLEGGEVRVTFIEKSDVNGDGKIDVADVVALTNAIMAGTKDLKYDINCDNQVNHDDVTALVDIILERNDKE